MGEVLAAWSGDLDAVLVVLEEQERARRAAHVAQLRSVLDLQAALAVDGTAWTVVPQLALVLGCSENRAHRLVVQGEVLGSLPDGLELAGSLSVEAVGVVVDQLKGLDLPHRLAVWRRLRSRLQADADSGTVQPPPRLAALLRRWVCAPTHVERWSAGRPRRPTGGLSCAVATTGWWTCSPTASRRRWRRRR